MIRLVFCFLLCGPAVADTVVAARTIPANAMIMPEDVAVDAQTIPGGIAAMSDVVGMEARVALFAGRPIKAGDIGYPAVVERNQIITLMYQSNGLVIATEGRALGRAGPGDTIRVMNINSRATVSARIGVDGFAYVQR